MRETRTVKRDEVLSNSGLQPHLDKLKHRIETNDLRTQTRGDLLQLVARIEVTAWIEAALATEYGRMKGMGVS